MSFIRWLIAGGALAAVGYAGCRAYRQQQAQCDEEERIDTALEGSFPASDPPSFTAERGVRLDSMAH